MINDEQKLNTKQCAQQNGVSAKTIIRWANAGMPHFHFEKQYLFYQSEVEAWMNENFRSGMAPNVFQLQERKASAR
jgi:predicted DNA-binding transcriptional regulator AlpA